MYQTMAMFLGTPLDWSPLRISLATSVTATAITLVAGVAAAAWRERRRGPAMALVDGILVLPLVLPPTVVGFLLLLIFGRNGLLGRMLLRLGTTVVFSWPGVLAGTILTFARALGEFGATLMLAGDIPGRTETIPIAIYFAVEAGDLHSASILCLLDVVISLVLLGGLYRWVQAPGSRRSQWMGR